MEIAVVLAAGLQDWIDFGVIIGILMMNAIVGWYQEKYICSPDALLGQCELMNSGKRGISSPSSKRV
jgi:hypothetical protein